MVPQHNSWRLMRPHGHIDLSVGIELTEINPYLDNESEHHVGNLQVLTSHFGLGYLFDGAHPSIHLHRGGICNTAFQYTWGQVMSWPTVINVCRWKVTFLETEELRVGQPRRCGTCKNCCKSSAWSLEIAVWEQAELDLIKQNVKLDTEKCHIIFHYAVIRDLTKLGNNMDQVIAIEAKVEARLSKKGVLVEYNEEMNGYLKCGDFWEKGPNSLLPLIEALAT